MEPAMRRFCEEFGKQKKVTVEFQSQAVMGSVPPDISLSLYRVLQEALHNAAKHSGAKHFRVQLLGTEGLAQLIVSDSGQGFDPEIAMRGHGLGLISMKERLHSVSGEITIEAQPHCGTTIHARVPFSPQSESPRPSGYADRRSV